MLDSITESIAHFIGHFHLATDDLRMRSTYESFQHAKTQHADHPRSPSPPVDTSTYDLEGFEPGLNWRPKPDIHRHDPDGPKLSPQDAASELPGTSFFSGQPALSLASDRTESMPDVPISAMVLPPPSSLAFVTIQTATLHDDDVIGDIASAGFASPEHYAPHLDQLIEAAHNLSAVALPHPEGATPWVGLAIELKADLASAAEGEVAASAPAGAEVHTIMGPVSGILIDGQTADAMPTLTDHMPALLKPEPEPETPNHDIAKDLPDGHEDTNPQLPGHHLVSGANAAVNESHVTLNWLDASVIAVRGDVIQIDAINQTNILSDRDDLGTPGAPQTPSTLLNAARIDKTATSSEGPADDPSTLPSNWAVTRIEGDLITYNWVKQLTFVTDHDRAVITSKGSNTSIGLGENEVINTSLLNALGFRFDLILTGGNLYDINVLTQRNVLLDDDVVSGGGTVSGGDNLLFNSASIQTTGIDGYEAISAVFENAIDDLTAGAASLSSALAQNSLFQGIDLLRVLYVAGDFVTMNVLDQVNIVGDADQVHVASMMAGLDPGAQFSIDTGSNALANIATISEFGIDSVVMAGGDIYSDAMIHQAGFVSIDAAPTGVNLQGLTSEAVAFLADGMIDEAGATVPDGDLTPPFMDAGGADVMQTMLA